MSERKEDWIKIVTPDGKHQMASPGYINRLLKTKGLDSEIFNLKNSVNVLKRKIKRLEAPYRQSLVIEYLTQENKPHNFVWLQNRIYELGFSDIETLLEKGKLFITKSGTQKLYRLRGMD